MTRCSPVVLASAIAALGLLAAPTASRADRPDTPGSGELPPLFDAGETVETFASPGGQFLVHFSRTGPNAVPADDVDTSGVPDFVQEVAATYDEVLAFYRDQLGFLAPLGDDIVSGDNGGDGRFDVYLVDFGGRADGSFRQQSCLAAEPGRCAGYMVQENDFFRYNYPSRTIGTRILASHELFHAVQAAYRVGAGSVLAEGTATWASEKFDPTLTDFESQSEGYLSRPDRSLDQEPTGPVDAFSYGAGLFFQFLDERHGEAVIRELWEAVAADGSQGWLPLLDTLLAASYQSSFAEAFAEFASWNLYTGPRANPERGYARGAGYPLVATAAAALPFSDDLVRLFHASARYYALTPGDRTQLAAAAVAPADEPETLDGVRLLLVVRHGDQLDEPVEAAAGSSAVVTVDATGADEVLAVLINTASSGDSRHPGLCLGSPEEVASCQVKLGGAAPSDGGPGPDTGGGLDGGLDGAGAADALAPVDASADAGADAGAASGGCQTAPGQGPWRASSWSLTLLLGLSLLWVARVRRGAGGH